MHAKTSRHIDRSVGFVTKILPLPAAPAMFPLLKGVKSAVADCGKSETRKTTVTIFP